MPLVTSVNQNFFACRSWSYRAEFTWFLTLTSAVDTVQGPKITLQAWFDSGFSQLNQLFRVGSSTSPCGAPTLLHTTRALLHTLYMRVCILSISMTYTVKFRFWFRPLYAMCLCSTLCVLCDYVCSVFCAMCYVSFARGSAGFSAG